MHNGTDPVAADDRGKSAHPTVCVVGRLVPHKQVEHAIDAVRRSARSSPGCGCTRGVRLVGGRAGGVRRGAGAGDTVVFEGHVDEVRKQEIYERSWVMALPSLKEGWGLVVGEAGMHGTPTVAYRDGRRHPRVDRSTASPGVLVDDQDAFTKADRGTCSPMTRTARGWAGAPG